MGDAHGMTGYVGCHKVIDSFLVLAGSRVALVCNHAMIL